MMEFDSVAIITSTGMPAMSRGACLNSSRPFASFSGKAGFVNQTFSLYSRAIERRPPRLLTQTDTR